MATDVIEKMQLLGEDRGSKTKVFDEEDLEKERQDMVQRMEAKKEKTLQYKRSFFVRMVSDPKIYNPKIIKIQSMDKSLNFFEEAPASPTMWVFLG